MQKLLFRFIRAATVCLLCNCCAPAGVAGSIATWDLRYGTVDVPRNPFQLIPLTPARFILLDSGGVFLSADSGASWHRCPMDPCTTPLCAATYGTTNIGVVCRGNVFYHSTDGDRKSTRLNS